MFVWFYGIYIEQYCLDYLFFLVFSNYFMYSDKDCFVYIYKYIYKKKYIKKVKDLKFLSDEKVNLI